VRVQHDEDAEVREFEVPLIPEGTSDTETTELQMDLLGIKAKTYFRPLKSGRQVFVYAHCLQDSRVGGWCEVEQNGRVRFAHPRTLAEQRQCAGISCDFTPKQASAKKAA